MGPAGAGRALRSAGAAALLCAGALAAQFSSPNITDPDALYHLGHAAVYREQGLFNSALPWVQFSVIGTIGADLWYGFHLLLIPFTFFADGIFAAKLAGAVVTALGLGLVAWSLERAGMRFALPAALLLALSSGDVLYRLNIARPHNLTLGLTLAVFAYALRGRPRSVFALAALAASLHLALGFLPVMAVTAVTAVRLVRRHPPGWDNLVWVVAGVLLGAALRPHPAGALTLAWNQIVDLLRVKAAGVPLLLGRELLPPNLRQFVRQVLPTAALLALAVVCFFRGRRQQGSRDERTERLTVAFTAAAALALFFFFVATFVARRGLDFFALFTIAALAAAATAYRERPGAAAAGPQGDGGRPPGSNGVSRRQRAAVAAAVLALVFALGSLPVFRRYMREAYPPDTMREVSLWLARTSRPGEIVYHARWDQFSTLFFWNRRNYYISGMDPIFLYLFDPALSWKSFWIAADLGVTRTCGKPRCQPQDSEETATVLARDFRASYLLLQRDLNPKFCAQLESVPVFPKLYDDGRYAVYRVLPARP
ncbi:MAG TPA: hypothetical protein VN317_01005 [Candidatus Methanoperedens sp.]|nr:hypothetical protein [Candidatus Methanoperedens sp.]